MTNIEFLQLAEDELQDTFEYYEYQQKNLGLRFVDEVYKSVKLISFYPNAWTKISKNTRRCLIKTFPYSIIYQNRSDKILVVAIANLHRKPDYWIDRL